jgi:hypothetical protein
MERSHAYLNVFPRAQTGPPSDLEAALQQRCTAGSETANPGTGSVDSGSTSTGDAGGYREESLNPFDGVEGIDRWVFERMAVPFNASHDHVSRALDQFVANDGQLDDATLIKRTRIGSEVLCLIASGMDAAEAVERIIVAEDLGEDLDRGDRIISLKRLADSVDIAIRFVHDARRCIEEEHRLGQIHG